MSNHTIEYMKAWYQKNADRIRPRKREEQRLRRAANPGEKYGLTREQYDAIVALQEGLCAICHRKKKLDVDHDHETNQVRGLLCRRCNVGLGSLGDNVAGLERALAYLKDAGA